MSKRRTHLTRRDLFRRGGQIGFAAGTLAALTSCAPGIADPLGGIAAGGDALAAGDSADRRRRIPPNDGDLLRFLAAAEIIETDLWSQYCELAENNKGFREALETIDDDMPDYICDNTADEQSHATFLNAYLESVRAEPVNLEQFRTLMPPNVEGLEQRPRLTNLTALNVDTSWVNRYLGSGNPDFGDSFEQIVNIQGRPAIPTSDTLTDTQLLTAAYVAAFHF